jgi:Domain of unknown function (DUF4232)
MWPAREVTDVRDLEEDLRRVLNDAGRALPPWPDASERVRTGMRARRRRGLLAWITGGLAAFAATAVAVAGPIAVPGNQQADVVPWLDLPPAEYPTPTLSTRPATTPCATADLRFDGVSTEGAGGTTFHLVRVRNAGTGACTLSGRPQLRAIDSRTGTTTTVKVATSTMWQPPDASAPTTIEHGEVAVLDIETFGGCLDGRPEINFSDAALRLADGGELPLQATLNGTCGVSMGEWYREAQPPSAEPYQFSQLAVEIEAPPSVRIGQTLDFVVVLANPTAADITLDPCPNYSVTVRDAPVKAGGVHKLNCLVTVVPTGERVRFAMRLDILTGGTIAMAGEASAHMEWSMDTGGETSSSATVPLLILPPES